VRLPGTLGALWKIRTKNHSKKMHRVGKVSAMEISKKARFNQLQSAA
jgi:hypothetical protein